MDHCNFCGNIMAYDENHTCCFHTFDSTYSQLQQFSENTCNSAQVGTPRKLPSFDIFSDIRVSYAGTNGNAFSAGTSENNEFRYRNENDFPEPFTISPVVMVSTGVEEEDQRGSGIPEMIHATGREEDEMSSQEYRWLSWNNDKMNCMDSPECVIRRDHSDNSNISALRNLVLNSDSLPISNGPEKDQTHVSEYVTEEHASLDMPSSLYSQSEKTDTCVMEHISSETDNNAMAGPSGLCSCKKKFSCPLCPKELYTKFHFDNHYRTHTKEKPFECKFCKKAFSQKGNLKVHIRTHTGEKKFVCTICKEAFRQNSTLKTHILTHTREKPYKCAVCGKAFTTSSARHKHQREIHK